MGAATGEKAAWIACLLLLWFARQETSTEVHLTFPPPGDPYTPPTGNDYDEDAALSARERAAAWLAYLNNGE